MSTTRVFQADRFNAGARDYADRWAPVLLPHARRLLARIPLASARRVLDIATGVGSLLPEIRAAAPDAHVVGIDIARAMLSLAPSGFDLAVMDAAVLALADASFDAAVMPFAVFFLPRPDAALREARRVLRPGAPFGVTSWYGEPTFPALDAWLGEIRALGAPHPRWAAETLEPAALRAELERAGFTDVRTTLERFDHQHDPATFLHLRLALMKPWLDSVAAD